MKRTTTAIPERQGIPGKSQGSLHFPFPFLVIIFRAQFGQTVIFLCFFAGWFPWLSVQVAGSAECVKIVLQKGGGVRCRPRVWWPSSELRRFSCCPTGEAVVCFCRAAGWGGVGGASKPMPKPMQLAGRAGSRDLQLGQHRFMLLKVRLSDCNVQCLYLELMGDEGCSTCD